MAANKVRFLKFFYEDSLFLYEETVYDSFGPLVHLCWEKNIYLADIDKLIFERI